MLGKRRFELRRDETVMEWNRERYKVSAMHK